MSSNYANEWSSGLCDCTDDCNSCCLTFWCPCVSFGRIAEILDKGESTCCGMACSFYLLNMMAHHGGFSWIITMAYRQKLRQQYGIQGHGCRDCMIHFWCQPCALCQEYRELQYHGFDVSAGKITDPIIPILVERFGLGKFQVHHKSSDMG